MASADQNADTGVIDVNATNTPENKEKQRVHNFRKPGFFGHILNRAILWGARRAYSGVASSGLKIKGRHNLDKIRDKKTIIVANHISFDDIVSIMLNMRYEDLENLAVAIDSKQYEDYTKNWFHRFVFSRLQMYPMNPNSPRGLIDLNEDFSDGTVKDWVVFPEGTLSRSGPENIMKVFGGTGRVFADQDDGNVQILPIYLDGYEHLEGKTHPDLEGYPVHRKPNLRMVVLDPVEPALPPKMTNAEFIKSERARLATKLDKFVRTYGTNIDAKAVRSVIAEHNKYISNEDMIAAHPDLQEEMTKVDRDNEDEWAKFLGKVSRKRIELTIPSVNAVTATFKRRYWSQQIADLEKQVAEFDKQIAGGTYKPYEDKDQSAEADPYLTALNSLQTLKEQKAKAVIQFRERLLKLLSEHRELDAFHQYKSKENRLDEESRQNQKQRRQEAEQAVQRIMYELPVKGRRKFPSLSAAFDHAVWRFGLDHPILRDNDNNITPVTYKDVSVKANAVSYVFQKHLDQGERFGSLLPGGIKGITAFMGAQKAGTVPCVLDPTLGVDILVDQLDTVQAKTIVTSRAYIDKLKYKIKDEDRDVYQVMAELEKRFNVVYLEDELMNVDELSLIGKIATLFSNENRPKLLRTMWFGIKGTLKTSLLNRDASGMAGVTKFIARTARAFGGLVDVTNQDKPASEVPAYILFTSGTTGKSKAVVFSHDNLQTSTSMVRSIIPISPSNKDRLFNSLPFFHSFGLFAAIGPVIAGVQSFQHPNPLDFNISELFRISGAKRFFGSPATAKLKARLTRGKGDISEATAFSGGGALKEEDRAVIESQGVLVTSNWGATEMMGPGSVSKPGWAPKDSIGRPLPDMRFSFKNADDIQLGYDEEGEIGELVVEGDNVAMGYMRHENPGVLEEFNGTYETGDIIFRDKDGFFHYKGRAGTEFFKHNDVRIGTGRILDFVMDATGEETVKDVIPGGDLSAPNRPIVFTTDPTDTAVLAERIKSAAARQGFSEMAALPKAHEIIYLPEIPTTSIGKAQKGVLMRWYRGAMEANMDVADFVVREQAAALSGRGQHVDAQIATPT